MRTIKIYIGIAALCILAASCVKEGKTVANETRKQYLEAWMDKNHNGVKSSGMGIYILEDTPGTGAAWTKENCYVSVDYVVTDLKGNITSTNSSKLARQLGTFNKAASYGPVIWSIGENASYAGVDEILSGMKVGGTRKAVIPSWLLTQKRYDTAEDYYNVSVDSSPLIYTITLKGMTSDLKASCTKDLHEFVRENVYSKADSVSYDNTDDGSKLGFYFVSIRNTRPDSTFKSGDVGYLYYVGRRLDGQVFDTNIADTAKVHGIYKSGNSYKPVKITFADKYTDIKMGDSSALINGFQSALFRMHAYEIATTLFYYGLGYGGSGQTLIPSYSSLWFDLQMVDDPDSNQ